MIRDILKYLSLNVRSIVSSQNEILLDKIYEIRIRIGNPIEVKTTTGKFFLSNNVKSQLFNNTFYKIKKNDIISTVSLLTLNSIHAFEEEIQKGYITIEGGNRVGLCGDCIYKNNKFTGYKNITSINIRIAKDYINCSNEVMKYIIKNRNSVYNTLIAGPPLCGKTTCIRDLARKLSNGILKPYFEGVDITVLDERGEIGAVYNGVPQMNIGCRTDILSYCMKKEGYIISIRALSPKIIISDELGSKDDFEIIQYAQKSGVNVISTAHCNNIDDLNNNIYLKTIIESKIIERIIILDSQKPITIKNVYYNDNNDGMICYDCN